MILEKINKEVAVCILKEQPWAYCITRVSHNHFNTIPDLLGWFVIHAEQIGRRWFIQYEQEVVAVRI